MGGYIAIDKILMLLIKMQMTWLKKMLLLQIKPPAPNVEEEKKQSGGILSRKKVKVVPNTHDGVGKGNNGKD